MKEVDGGRAQVDSVRGRKTEKVFDGNMIFHPLREYEHIQVTDTV